MTYKEALNQLIRLSPIQARNDLERYLLRGEKPIPKAVAIGMKALEKQIPKKPDYEGDGYADGEIVYEYARCPVCGNDEFEEGVNNWGCKFCPDCGQALDWSDTE